MEANLIILVFQSKLYANKTARAKCNGYKKQAKCAAESSPYLLRLFSTAYPRKSQKAMRVHSLRTA